jgi:hypothetical protein
MILAHLSIRSRRKLASIGAAAMAVAAAGAALADLVLADPVLADSVVADPEAEAPAAEASRCLSSGDGYLRARVRGAVEAHVDWPNKGTHCDGEPRSTPAGIRLSFKRSGDPADLLFVFGLTGVREGQAAREVGANLTVIAHGRIFGTLGDARCTVDSLTQRRIGHTKLYRVEARGFCTQPAHAVRGDGAVLVSTFEFAGPVNYELSKDAEMPSAAKRP